MGCNGRSHKLGFLLSLQWVFSGFLVGLRWIFVGLRWVWVLGDRRRLADLEVVSRWLRSALSCRSGGGLAVVQLRGGAWVRNKLRGGAGLRRSEAEWLPAGLAVGQDVVAGGCVAVNGG
jgi:hypothetical protein